MTDRKDYQGTQNNEYLLCLQFYTQCAILTPLPITKNLVSKFNVGDRVRLVNIGEFEAGAHNKMMNVRNFRLGSFGTVFTIYNGVKPYVRIDESGLIDPLFNKYVSGIRQNEFVCEDSMLELVHEPHSESKWFLTDPKAFDRMYKIPYYDYTFSYKFKSEFYPTFIPSTKKSTMNSLVSKVADLFITEPQKTFRKLGITDERNNLTGEGERVFINWLFTQNQDAFNTAIAQPLLAAQEKK